MHSSESPQPATPSLSLRANHIAAHPSPHIHTLTYTCTHLQTFRRPITHLLVRTHRLTRAHARTRTHAQPHWRDIAFQSFTRPIKLCIYLYTYSILILTLTFTDSITKCVVTQVSAKKSVIPNTRNASNSRNIDDAVGALCSSLQIP